MTSTSNSLYDHLFAINNKLQDIEDEVIECMLSPQTNELLSTRICTSICGHLVVMLDNLDPVVLPDGREFGLDEDGGVSDDEEAKPCTILGALTTAEIQISIHSPWGEQGTTWASSKNHQKSPYLNNTDPNLHFRPYKLPTPTQ